MSGTLFDVGPVRAVNGADLADKLLLLLQV